ncbi:MAG: PH domain-containing protein [Thermoplasmata archaeon]|nr:PH domain-containing protein [Thermoplasmata archaeon]
MSGTPAPNLGPAPKLLKAAYLATRESILRETRATALFYFPGPVLAVLLFGILDYSSASTTYGWPSFPFLSDRFQQLSNWNSSLGRYVTIFLTLLLVIALLWLLIRYLRWITTVYAVTTHRVIIQRGILGRDFDEIPVPQVRGVDVRQSVGQRLLGYGTVTVSSEGGGGIVGHEAWQGIPRPFEFQRLVESANQAITAGAYSASPGPSRGTN